MIETYVKKLIENIPVQKEKTELDLVLDGGVFNGSYLIGALYFLREMEKRKWVQIDRISGCSIGSISGLLFFIDRLDLFQTYYNSIFVDFQQNYSLESFKTCLGTLEDYIPDDILEKVNNKLFISYYNIVKQKKIVKSVYKDKKDILQAILKSCYVPFLMDGSLLYKKKYMDGIIPYVFPIQKGKKILCLDLLGYDKISYMLNVKNEKTNYHRILTGLLDIHQFYIKRTYTPMCSYVNDWNLWNHAHNIFKKIIEKVILWSILFIFFLKKNIPDFVHENIWYGLFKKTCYEMYIVFLQNYCF